MRLSYPFFRLDECTFHVFFSCVRHTDAASAGLRLKIKQCWISAFAASKSPFDVILLLLLFEQSSRKPRNKYYDVGRILSSSTRLPHAFVGHMERQLHTVAGCRVPGDNRMRQPDTWDGSLKSMHRLHYIVRDLKFSGGS